MTQEANQSWERELIDALAEGVAVDRWFVVLATSLKRRINALSNLLRDANPSLTALAEELSNPTEETLAKWLDDIRAIERSGVTDIRRIPLALRLVVATRDLDRAIGGQGKWLPRGPITFECRTYRIVPRSTVLAERSGLLAKVAAEDQGGGMGWLLRRCAVIDELDYELHALPERERKQLVVHASDGKIHLLAATPTADFSTQWNEVAPARVHMGAPETEDDVCDQLTEFVNFARTSETSLLVLPELTVTERGLGALTTRLKERPSHPVLTVVGLTHPETPAEGYSTLYLNEALVLDSAGDVLFRYCKHTAVAVVAADAPALPESFGKALRDAEWDALRDRFVREATAIAEDDYRFPLLPTPIGLLAVAICLDLFHERGFDRIRNASATLLALPSLSPVTAPHERAAATLGAQRQLVSVVANRPMQASHDARQAAPAFLRLADVHHPDPRADPKHRLVGHRL